ncbi:MAG: NifB/NifX family molybdenum-iron cluster-binding protein [Planctomycetia bacterium]
MAPRGRQRDGDGDDDRRSQPPAGRTLALGVWHLRLPAAPRPGLLRRDRAFDLAAPSMDVADILRYAGTARRSLKGPLALEIDGPGDPLASADTVLRALALLHEHHPEVLTGLCIDGPLLGEYADELREFGLAWVRCVSSRTRAARMLVAGALHRGEALERAEAAALLLEEAPRALHVARRVGLAAVARITLFPTLNASEVGELARVAARAEVARVEVVPHEPRAGTPLARVPAPTAGELAEARELVERVLAEERGEGGAHGVLDWLTPGRLKPVALDTLDADDLRHLLAGAEADELPLAPVLPQRRAQIVAVASEDGALVDLPLTHAPAVRLFAVTGTAITPLGARALPEDPRRQKDGVGHARDLLEALLGCRALVATRIPPRAATLLKAVGIVPITAGGPVPEVLDRVARGTLRSTGA